MIGTFPTTKVIGSLVHQRQAAVTGWTTGFSKLWSSHLCAQDHLGAFHRWTDELATAFSIINATSYKNEWDISKRRCYPSLYPALRYGVSMFSEPDALLNMDKSGLLHLLCLWCYVAATIWMLFFCLWRCNGQHDVPVTQQHFLLAKLTLFTTTALC